MNRQFIRHSIQTNFQFSRTRNLTLMPAASARRMNFLQSVQGCCQNRRVTDASLHSRHCICVLIKRMPPVLAFLAVCLAWVSAVATAQPGQSHGNAAPRLGDSDHRLPASMATSSAACGFNFTYNVVMPDGVAVRRLYPTHPLLSLRSHMPALVSFPPWWRPAPAPPARASCSARRTTRWASRGWSAILCSSGDSTPCSRTFAGRTLAAAIFPCFCSTAPMAAPQWNGSRSRAGIPAVS
jgi:hypothetical protein